ncbi:geranylgeranyl pyrophosphate synthase-like [Watersipora subatra]|uniref:geranylgeranyl pyrophosphate synthase-like n=1 Tax=Watersipora subatra TaxID=2589382 RepID=UPI00355C9BBB
MDMDKMKEQEEQVLLGPYKYILQIPGKNIRTKLAAAFNYWLKISDEVLSKIGEVTQMLHNASLLIDDIEDNSALRRGIPVAHHIYGTPTTLNSANYIYFLGLQKLLELGNPAAAQVFTEQLLELHRGQGMDIHWRDSYTCPTEEQYKLMVKQKTGGLFGLAIRLMQLFSENQVNLGSLTDNLGLYFQIRDDYANLWSSVYEQNKTYCEDLTEGKFSFPIIYAIQSHPEDNQIMSIVRQRTTDNDVKKYCVQRITQFGAREYTTNILLELETELYDQIEKLGGNPLLVALIDGLSELYKG